MTRDALAWLSKLDPALEWQVQRDLRRESDEACQMTRVRIAHGGWGDALFTAQRDDGSWAADEPTGWADSSAGSVAYALTILRVFQVDPDDTIVRRAIDRAHEASAAAHSHDEPDARIAALTLANAAYFHRDDEMFTQLADRLAEAVPASGGGAVGADVVATALDAAVCALEGLTEWNRVHPAARFEEAIAAHAEWLVEHGISAGCTEPFASAPGLHFDPLRTLDALRAAGISPNARLDTTLDAIEAARGSKGRWPQGAQFPGLTDGERSHWVVLAPGVAEAVGEDSPFVTLRALRVLRWAGSEAGDS